jgi:hypothetical protein
LSSIPFPGARNALLDAYRTGFSSTLNELMIIGAVIAFLGAAFSLTLVRQKDFVPSGPADAPPGGGPPSEPADLAAVA